MQALHDAILDALFNGGVLPEETIERLLGDPADADQGDARSKLEELIQQIIERMADEGYISMPPDLEAARAERQGRGAGSGPETTSSRRRSSKSPTRRSTSSATARCAICSARSARAATAATTRASRRPASKRPARRSRTSSATR